jgi:hypothetical protein
VFENVTFGAELDTVLDVLTEDGGYREVVGNSGVLN